MHSCAFHFILLLVISVILEAILATVGWNIGVLLMASYWLFMKIEPRKAILMTGGVAAFLDALWHHPFPFELCCILLLAFVVSFWRTKGDRFSLPALLFGGMLCGAVRGIMVIVKLMSISQTGFWRAFAHALGGLMEMVLFVPLVCVICNICWTEEYDYIRPIGRR